MEYLSILEYDALNIDKQLVTEISEKLSPPPPPPPPGVTEVLFWGY